MEFMNNNGLKNLITIGSLPSMVDLKYLFNQGIKELVNVSGIDLTEIYYEQNISYFNQSKFVFSDLFSKYDLIDSLSELEKIDQTLFLNTFHIEQQQEFKSAVLKTIELLHLNKSIYIFCHHGVGRSPAVSFAALNIFLKQSIYDSLRMIDYLRPQAKITMMTISATYWLKRTLSDEQLI